MVSGIIVLCDMRKCVLHTKCIGAIGWTSVAKCLALAVNIRFFGRWYGRPDRS